MAFEQAVDTFGGLERLAVGVEIAKSAGEGKEGAPEPCNEEKLVEGPAVIGHYRRLAVEFSKDVAAPDKDESCVFLRNRFAFRPVPTLKSRTLLYSLRQSATRSSVVSLSRRMLAAWV
jgi:hypothetical protein